MYTALTVIIILVSVLLGLVVLIQNPKGGGIVSGIIGSSQVMGVKKTSDFIEKLTWGLAASLVILCLAASFSLPSSEDRKIGTSMQEQIENSTPASTTPANPAPVQHHRLEMQNKL
jgi:preprotein translocase subunit SecG